MADKKVSRDAWVTGRVWKGTDRENREVEAIILKDSTKINYKFCVYKIYDQGDCTEETTKELPHRQLLKYMEPTKKVVEVTDEMIRQAGL